MVQGWLGIKHHDMLQKDGVSMDLSMGSLAHGDDDLMEMGLYICCSDVCLI